MSGNELEAANRDLEARVKELEGVASNYRLAAAKMEHLQRERRYRLLQAAATIYAGGQHEVRQEPPDTAYPSRYMSNWHTPQSAVTEAEGLLDVIEQRENAEAKS